MNATIDITPQPGDSTNTLLRKAVRALAELVLVGSTPAPEENTAPEIVIVSDPTYSLSDADHGRFLHFTVGCTVTVPPGLMAGFSVVLVQEGASAVVVDDGGAVTINHPDAHTQTRAQYSSATLWRRGATTYYFGGDTA